MLQAKEIEDGKVKQERSGVVLQGSPKGAIKKTKSKSALNSPARSFSYSEDSLRRVPQSATRSSVSLSECKPSGSQSEFYSVCTSIFKFREICKKILQAPEVPDEDWHN